MFVEPISAYFAHFKTPAVFFDMAPEAVAAFVGGGGEGVDIDLGFFKEQAETVGNGYSDQIKHTPYYQLPTSKFTELSIGIDQALELFHPDREVDVLYRIASWEHHSGITHIRLQGTSV